MTTLYGIPNCDTVKKARRWLAAHDIAYRFHDLRRDGLDEALLGQWIAELGWEALLNRRGTTWRQLPEATRATIDRASAARLMLAQPALIRRPVLARGRQLHAGFSAADYATLFGETVTA